MRLTKEMKRNLKERLTTNMFKADEAKLIELELAVANTFRDALLGNFKQVIDTLPLSWVNETSRVRIKDTNRDWESHDFSFSTERNFTLRMPIRSGGSHNLCDFESHKDFSRAYDKWEKFREKLNNDKAEFRNKIGDTLAGFTTSNKLLEEFPELEATLKEAGCMDNTRAIAKVDFTEVHNLVKKAIDKTK